MDQEPGSRLIHSITALASLDAGRLVLGFSGGLDSSVLLAALVRAGLAPRLCAVHVHHGLQPGADAWADHCRRVCADHGVGFVEERLQLAPGGNLEGRARDARRAALLRHVGAADQLWLAHHRDDQAETLLLRLMRGSGSRGLGGMREVSFWQGRRLMRPLLDLGRDELAALAGRWGLDWVEDPSNLDLRPDRNFLRGQVLPLLRQRWPAASRKLAAAARHLGEDAELLEALAGIDLQACDLRDDNLSLAAFGALPPARQRNLLRGWLQHRGLRPPSAAVLQRVLDELLAAGGDRLPQVRWAEAMFTRFRERLYLLDSMTVTPWHGESLWQAATRVVRNGVVIVEQVGSVGQADLSLAARGLPLRLRAARGGERLLLRGHHRQVSELWRAAGIPPWRRRQLPLLFHDGELVAAAGAGVTDPWQPRADEAALHLRVRVAEIPSLRL